MRRLSRAASETAREEDGGAKVGAEGDPVRRLDGEFLNGGGVAAAAAEELHLRLCRGLLPGGVPHGVPRLRGGTIPSVLLADRPVEVHVVHGLGPLIGGLPAASAACSRRPRLRHTLLAKAPPSVRDGVRDSHFGIELNRLSVELQKGTRCQHRI